MRYVSGAAPRPNLEPALGNNLRTTLPSNATASRSPRPQAMSFTVSECDAIAMGTVTFSAPIAYPRRHVGAGQVMYESAPRAGRGRNFRTHSAQASMRLAFAQVSGLPMGPSESKASDTPSLYEREALDRVSAGQGLSGHRWQVKDSNLRSFRDGFTVRFHWPLGQPAVVRLEG